MSSYRLSCLFWCLLGMSPCTEALSHRLVWRNTHHTKGNCFASLLGGGQRTGEEVSGASHSNQIQRGSKGGPDDHCYLHQSAVHHRHTVVNIQVGTWEVSLAVTTVSNGGPWWPCCLLSNTPPSFSEAMWARRCLL